MPNADSVPQVLLYWLELGTFTKAPDLVCDAIIWVHIAIL